MRASDAERDAAVDRLGGACGEGRLTLAEFSDRVGLALAASTLEELDGLVADLPAAITSTPTATSPGRGEPTQWEVHPLGGVRRTGRWRVPPKSVIATLLGGTRLDLREAVLGADVVSMTLVALVGGVRVIVPPGIEVDVDGLTLLGGKRVDTDPPAAGSRAPRLRIRTVVFMGGVHVNGAESPGRPSARLGGNERSALRRAQRRERRRL